MKFPRIHFSETPGISWKYSGECPAGIPEKWNSKEFQISQNLTEIPRNLKSFGFQIPDNLQTAIVVYRLPNGTPEK